MKFRWAVLLLLLGAGGAGRLQAQSSAAVYGEFNVSRFHNLVSDSYLEGGTAGFLVDAFKLKRFTVGGDIQGRFLAGSGRTYLGAAIGPRIGVPIRPFHLVPYGEFMVGFARLNGNAQDAAYDGPGSNSTDSQIQLNAGVTKQLTPHFDAVVEYSYSQFYANGGQFNPKTFSAGAIYHFTKR